MKTITNFKVLAVLFACLFFTSAKSQCAANFTYTTNSNGNVSFSNFSVPNSPGTTYNWLFGDNQSSSQANPSHTYGANGVYNVTLFMYDSISPCTNTFVAQITITNVACNVNPGFTSSLNSNNSVTFVNTSTGTIPQTMYYLQYGDNSSSNFPNNSFTTANHSYNPGNYTATLTVFNSSVSCFASYTANISIPTCPIVSGFNLVKDTTVIPAIVWNAYPTYPANVTGVSWSWGDNTYSSSLYPTHNYATAGVYNICLTVSVSCGSATTTCLNQNIFKTSSNNQMATINVLASSPTGIAKNNTSATIRLYPNPVKDILNIESDAADVNVTITDLYGKVVYNGVRSNDSKVNVETLKAGIYFVKISNTEFSKTTKLVKE